MSSVADRLAVCHWSLQSTSPEHLITQLKEIGLSKIQLGLDEPLSQPQWSDVGRQLNDAGVQVVGGMMRCVGEDYTTMQTIAKTGGVVPDETWPATWKNMQGMAPIARKLGLTYVMFHAGFIPHDHNDPTRGKLIRRLAQVADLFGDLGIKVGFETGQEDAPTLLALLKELGKKNVGVNFDPANIILYDMGDPIEALRLLAPHVIQVHLKDARRTKVKGEWGTELAVGDGEVDWKSFFAVLKQAGFNGPMALEREAENQRVADIKRGKEFVLRL